MPPIDRPVWASLTGAHMSLSVGGSLARRYAPDVNLFASTCDEAPESLAALAALVHKGGRVFLLQVPPVVIPEGLSAIKRAKGVQMVASRSLQGATSSDGIVPLTDSDAPDMLALAALTEPGPFLARTHQMGTFFGIRINGRLAAMAGERFRFPGHTEVSGVCTHPDFRGRGLARRLSAAVAAHIEARGEQPFLHAWQTNLPAIALYESLGFVRRCDVDVAVMERAG